MITGDEDMATSTLVGTQHGYHYRRVVDRFIHTVTKMEETADKRWADHRLTTACREGYTLIYDEFTRSRPEANNVLLSVLEEGLLVLPAQNQNEPYIKVHPDFRVIFTSNPQEYAGVHDAQDALGDRIVTIDVRHADRELEIAVAAARSGLAPAKVAPIVDMVREFRETGEYDQTPTLRTSIMICRMMSSGKAEADDRRPPVRAVLHRHPRLEVRAHGQGRRQARAAAQDAAQPDRAPLSQPRRPGPAARTA